MPFTPAHNHYHILRMREMGRIYWCHSLASIGAAIVAIFVPIFLLKSGYSFHAVLSYIIIQQFMAALLQYPTSSLLEVLRPNHQLALGNLFYAIFFGLLITLHHEHWPLWIIALAWALNRGTYWSAFHYSFASSRGHKHGGRQIAGLNALVMFGQTVAPAVGGIIATICGITYIYILAIAVLVIASVPMLDTEGAPAQARLHLTRRELWEMRPDLCANFCNGIILMAEGNIWPLLVYLLVTSYAGIGILSSVIAIASISATLYVGRKQEVTGEGHYIKRGLGAYSLASIGRSLAVNSGQVFGLNLLGGVARSLYVPPYMNRYYTNSDGDSRLGYITAMETAFGVGAGLYMLGLLGLTHWLAMKTVLAFGLAAIAIIGLGVRLIR